MLDLDRTPRPLAGRRVELATVLNTFTGRSDRPVLLVSGEAGIGKSRLLTVAIDIARAEGATVLSASCLPLTEAAPLLPIGDILRAALEVEEGTWMRDALERCPGYVATAVAPLVPELTSSEHAATQDALWRQRLFVAVRLVLNELARLRRLAVVIEDAHWSDSSTLDLLDHLLHAGDGPPAPLVVSFRADDPDVSAANAGWFDRAARSRRASTLELKRLTHTETVEQVALATGTVDPALAAALHARSEGNPLFTEQLLGSHGTLPADLRAVFDEKLGRLSPEQRDVLTALAVVGRPLPAQLLGQLVDGQADLGASLRDLRAARLLRSDEPLVTLRHALLADAILADLPHEQAQRLSARVASAMPSWAEHGSASEIAEHWQRAGDARQELAWRIRAAEAAYQAHANVEAVHQWLRVIAVWDEVADAEDVAGMPLYEVYLTADWAFFDAGLTQRSVGLMDAAAERFAEAPPIVLASILRRQGRNRSWSSLENAGELIERSHALFAESEPVTEWVYACSDLADARRGQGRYEEAIDAANRGIEVALACGATSLLRRMYAHRALSEAALGDLERARRTLEDLARAPEPDTLRERTVVATRHSDLLLAMGRYEEVPAATFPVLELVAEFGALGSRLSLGLRANAAEALMMLGRLDEAQAEMVLGAESPTSEISLVDVQLGEVALLKGDLEAAEALFADLVRRWPDVPDWTPPLWSRRAELQLWAGHPDQAFALASRGLGTCVDDEGRESGWLLVLAARAAADNAVTASADQRQHSIAELDALRASLAVRDPLDASAAPTAAALSAIWQAERARLANTDEPTLWDRAATEWHRLGARFRAAYCSWRHAEALLARRSRDPDAATHLRTAYELGTGHVPLCRAIERTASRARIELAPDERDAASTPPPSTTFGLTPRELAVLQLLGQGRTNAQIGAELFMSTKTASVHVTNILRKLEATSRTQAAAIAERAGLLT